MGLLETRRIPPDTCTTAKVSIRWASPADLGQVVTVHTAAFPGFFLTALGPEFLRAYYRAVLDFDAGLLLVAEVDGRVAGFASGFGEPQRFYGGLRRSPVRFAPALAMAIMRRPWLIGRIATRIGAVVLHGRGSRPAPTSAGACELSSLAVDPAVRRCGLGRQLVAAFVATARARGLTAVWLTTDARGNDPVNTFYASLGFCLVNGATAAEPRPMNEYQLSLSEGGLPAAA